MKLAQQSEQCTSSATVAKQVQIWEKRKSDFHTIGFLLDRSQIDPTYNSDCLMEFHTWDVFPVKIF